jgi:hypothetical protein
MPRLAAVRLAWKQRCGGSAILVGEWSQKKIELGLAPHARQARAFRKSLAVKTDVEAIVGSCTSSMQDGWNTVNTVHARCKQRNAVSCYTKRHHENVMRKYGTPRRSTRFVEQDLVSSFEWKFHPSATSSGPLGGRSGSVDAALSSLTVTTPFSSCMQIPDMWLRQTGGVCLSLACMRFL